MIDPASVELAFQRAISDAGLDPPKELIADGKTHRFRAGARDSDQSGFYVLHMDDSPAGRFGCWRRLPEGQGWSYRNLDTLSQEEREALRAKWEAQKQAQAQERAEIQAQKAQRNQRRWERASRVEGDDHPYLRAKGVLSHGLRQDRGGLLVPFFDGHGTLSAIQAINPDAATKKRIIGRYFGCGYPMGPSPEEFGVEWLCEGYATAATVLEVLGEPVCVAGNNTNLRELALERLRTHPHVALKIGADNDLHTAPLPRWPRGNPGIYAALEAVGAVRAAGGRASIHWPDLPENAAKEDSDWNDLARLCGKEEVSRQLGIDREGEEPPSASAPRDSSDSLQGRSYGGEVPVRGEAGKLWPPLVGPYVMEGNGLFKLEYRQDAPIETMIAHRPIWVHALSEGPLGEPGLVIRYLDRLGRLCEQVLPSAILHAQAQIMAGRLADLGFRVVPGKEKEVSRFLAAQEAGCTRVIASRSRLGWHQIENGDYVFVLPGNVIGGGGAIEIVYQSDIAPSFAASIGEHGTLSEWQHQVARPCLGNPLLMFSILLGLSGPLFHLVGEDCGGFHFYGTSSRGKTTQGQVGASVWGNGAAPSRDSGSYVRTWSSTINALEGIAELHSHQLLVLDDIGSTEMLDPGKAVYKLASGTGKGRMGPFGALQPNRTWLGPFMSNGEQSLRSIMGRKGADFFTGQRIRLLDVPASDMVVDTHGAASDVFVDELKRACSEYFGSAGPHFAAYLIAKMRAAKSVRAYRDELRRAAKLAEEELIIEACARAGILDGSLPNELKRGMRRFSVVCLAGILAGSGESFSAEIIPYSQTEVYRCVTDVAALWLSDMGQERSEIERAIGSFRSQLLACGARFQPAADDDRQQYDVRDRLGWRYRDPEGGWWYLVLPGGMADLCGLYDEKTVMEELSRRKVIRHDPGHGYRVKAPRNLPGLEGTRPRLIWISASVVSDEPKEGGDAHPF